MNNRILLIIGVGIVSMWNIVTTIYGTYSILGDGNFQLAISIMFSLLMYSFLISTIPILRNPNNYDILVVSSKILWFLSLLYDLYISFIGNSSIIINEKGNSISQNILIVGITVFVCSAPIAFSSILYNNRY